MNNYFLIAGLILIVLIAIKTYSAMGRIERMRTTGSKAYKKDFFYRIILKHFFKNMPD